MWRRLAQRVTDAVQKRAEDMHMMWSEVRHRTHYPEEMMLFEFKTSRDIEQYTTTTDAILGGSSVCNFYLKEYKTFSSGCFEGIIDFQTTEEYCNGGFANFRTKPECKKQFSEFLWYYPAIQMRIKTDGRRYKLNLHSSKHSNEDVFQAEMTSQRGVWETLVLPFDELKLVHRGVISDYQVQLQREHLCGMGVLLADQENGPFRFEIQYLKAISPNLFDQEKFDGGKRHNTGAFVRKQSEQLSSGLPEKRRTRKLISPEERKRRARANPGEINPFDD